MRVFVVGFVHESEDYTEPRTYVQTGADTKRNERNE
jgi:hypothetical protein